MQNSIVRIFAVTLFAVGSFATLSARAPQQVTSAAVAAPGPQTPIPICASCGRGGDSN